jgi:propanol-preferring alcohol dehydrogenase
MKAARIEKVGEPLHIRDIEVPKIGRKEVLVKVKATGVCHSDVHLGDGGYGSIRIVEDLGAKIPITLGHEISGVIEEIGEEVSGYSVGDTVVIDPWIGDGTCRFCTSGHDNLCDHPTNLGENVDGGYAEFVKVPDFRYLAITKMSPSESATLSCSGLTAYSAIKRGDLSPNKNLLIIGAGGGLGSMAIQLSKIFGSPVIIGIDTNDDALRNAKIFGADYVLNVNERDFQKEIVSLTNGYGPDVVVDLNSSDFSLQTFIPLLAKGGRYIMVGLYGGKIVHDSPLLINYQKYLMTSVVGTLKEFKELVELSNRGHLRSTITKSIKLEDVNEALDNLKKGSIKGRQVVIF